MEKLLYAFLLSLASIVTFSGLRKAEAVWDERQVITAANEASEASLVAQLRDIWRPQRSQAYQPLAPTVELVARTVAPTELSRLAISHAVQMGLHLLNALLILLVLSLVLGSSGAAFWGALLFALHPLQVEALASPTALPIMLGTFFSLLAIYLLFVSQQQDSRQDTRPGPQRLATLFFIAALLTTPAAAVAPLMALILLPLRPLQRSSLGASRSSPWILALWLGLALIPVFWAIRAQEVQALAAQLPVWLRPLIAGDALSFYLGKILVPYHLGPDYGRSPAYVLSHWWGYASILLPFALALALAFLGELRAAYYAALGLFFLGLLPFLGLALFPAQATSTVADSFVYFAMIGPALAWGATLLVIRSAWLPVLSVVGLAALGWVSAMQMTHWESTRQLWDYTVTVNPRSPKVHRALADAALAQGKWDEARTHYEQVLAVTPLDARTSFQLGTIESGHGSPTRAIAFFEKAIQLDPTLVEAHGRLGRLLYDKQRHQEALPHFQRAVALAPKHPLYLRYLGMLAVERESYAEAVPHLQAALEHIASNQIAEKAQLHALLGRALSRTEQPDAAQKHLEQALALDPQQADAHRLLADIYFDQKRWQDARVHYEVALLTQNQDPELHRRLGLIRLQGKQYDKAVAAFTEALRLRRDWPEVLSNLGTAYYYLRRFPEAKATLQRSLALNPKQAEPYYIMGEIARWQGPESTAAAAFEQAIRIDPNHVEAHFRLGNWLLQKRRFAEAVNQYKAALRAAPDDARLSAQLQKAERREPDAMFNGAASR